MKKLPLLLLFAAVAPSLFAQGEPHVSQTTKNYREYRLMRSTPPYSLAKVQSMVKHIKIDSEDNRVLSAKSYNALTPREKFTYVMIHGENMNQNCDGMPFVVDEEKKAFAHFPDPFEDEEAGWSDRERAFMKNNRALVITLMRDQIRKQHRVGLNYKAAIEEINGVELIPDLLAVYKRDHKDHDLLTLFFLLMKQGQYKPFMESATYKKLYGDESNYKAFIVANPENQQLTIQRVTEFYRSTK